MYRQPSFKFLFALLVTVALLHIFAIKFFFYWEYSWFDNLMHFLGGFLVAYAALWVFFQSSYLSLTYHRTSALLVATAAIITVGVGWEVFEYLAGLSLKENIRVDTISDLWMDALGAAVGYVAFTRLTRPYDA